jgi:hypothetical protein
MESLENNSSSRIYLTFPNRFTVPNGCKTCNGMEWDQKYSMEYDKYGMEYLNHGM